MNEAFYELPKEKQKAIYNAAMEVFGNYEYKRASTDLIATKVFQKDCCFIISTTKKRCICIPSNMCQKL